ncbi:MAG: glycoside hydrolase family 73 protein [Flavobacteriales bacterium]
MLPVLRHILFVASMIVGFHVMAQPAERRTSRKEYIMRWKDEAVSQMMTYGIPASITLAQGILESADGNSPLAKYANNHFGIKCHDWTGETFIQDDDAKNECFRKYEDAQGSYRDHSLFLKDKSRYAFLFDYTATDYKNWANGLKKAGYATNAQYASRLIQIIEENELYKYDKSETFARKEIKPEKDAVATITVGAREIKVHDNNIRFVIAKDGDTAFKLAKEFEMGLWQIYKYNDLGGKDEIKAGDVIYLQPKRNKASEAFHQVKAGETMRTISQLYGVKLKKLYKKNNMERGTEPEVGATLYLKKSKQN